MRGWRLIGPIVELSRGTGHVRVKRAANPVAESDIVSVSCGDSGPLRSGSARVERVLGDDVLRFPCPLTSFIPAACEGDFLFVATAIGEDAFKVLS